MYLSEEKRAEIRQCIENQRSNSVVNSSGNNGDFIKGFHDTDDVRKVSQILFDARDGKEIFTPF
ncbi:MAG: hypothetical protein KKE44_17935 [Proteobacteria bacterium]|nr:hypothetical protein [Pseudomonadota bacterium]MBU1584613.1 hypothetical protein [Pseudomonadota bacterium]MBU2453098.1 hypothetical protein [Pseudomonadota bacterium]MBU2626994.1 hypothetical protein [Pseudomonadota bacterium]